MYTGNGGEEGETGETHKVAMETQGGEYGMLYDGYCSAGTFDRRVMIPTCPEPKGAMTVSSYSASESMILVFITPTRVIELTLQ